MDKAQAAPEECSVGRRAEYAVPRTEARLSPQVDKAQATPEGCSVNRKPKTFWTQNSNETSPIYPARKILRISTGKATERANTAVETIPRSEMLSTSVQQGRTLHGVTGVPLQNLKGTGKPARAGGRCNVTDPSRLVRPQGGPGTDPRPVPAVAAAPTRIRVSTHTCRAAESRRPD
jgi:hypothetical protein